ncbi:hypothetical protein [Micromonospora sp. b486]|uniref:hypothetical protein n=1 Tax=Micromonospora sp. b486 TaxID=3053986 RepID=UPI00259C8184|nr:hypothetical protein [Micromonospora sp. b486]MDM4784527.1 hypothetical protein [Micromonospora sp. b486]
MFMPLRGSLDDARRIVAINEQQDVALVVNKDQTVDGALLAGVLDTPAHTQWTGVIFPPMVPYEWIELWLALRLPNSNLRMTTDRAAIDRGQVTPMHPQWGAMATVEGPSLAYLTLRPAEPVDGQKRYEIGLIGHGPDGIALADITAEEAARWDREYRSRSVRFEIPIGRAGEHAPDKGRFVIDRPHHPSPSSGNRAMLAGTTAHRFPLVARSRPLCTALPARIGALADLAARAQHDNDLTAAARVYNQAALIASDCGQTDLARQWCHRHAQAWLDRPDLTTTPAATSSNPWSTSPACTSEPANTTTASHSSPSSTTPSPTEPTPPSTASLSPPPRSPPPKKPTATSPNGSGASTWQTAPAR